MHAYRETVATSREFCMHFDWKVLAANMWANACGYFVLQFALVGCYKSLEWRGSKTHALSLRLRLISNTSCCTTA
jgi:hypothetical protein